MPAGLLVISALLMLLYIYIGYPFLLWVMSRLTRHEKPLPACGFFPTVSLIVAAYNEEKVIAKKIRNSLSLDYPSDKLEILVFSDGSTDNTDRIVREFQLHGVKLIRIEGRKGKTFCQNRVAAMAQGQVLVFSDANSMYRRDALKHLAKHFANSGVGAVSGEGHYVNPRETVAGQAEGLYLRYEHAIKRLETRVVSVAGASGPIYAVAKEAYVPLEPWSISDFLEPLFVFRNGYRVVYEPQAVSFEQAASSLDAEFRRKRRIVGRAWRALWSARGLLNPFKHGLFAFQLISHKVLRWLVPFTLIAMLVASLSCTDCFVCLVALCLQMAFYLTALVGYIWPDLPLYPITYFCLVSWASLLGTVDALLGQTKVTWEKER